ncbi:hypothetical protein BT69DRAFT_1330270 [Atractiella rhizophila]|nr:hypothetical protein BT69DRAFT_1330270 [Atractiella rhizophila]
MSSFPPINAANLLGPWLIGGLLSAALVGIVILQGGAFYYHYPNERWILRLLVGGVLVLSISTAGVTFGLCWHYLINGRDNDAAVRKAPRIQPWVFLTPVFSALLAQTFFAYRCWGFLNKKRGIGLILLIFISFPFVSGVVNWALVQVLFKSLANPTKTAELTKKIQVTLYLWVWSTAVTDLAISALLAWNVSKTRHGFNATTDNLLLKLIQLSLTTAALTSLMAILDAIFSAVFASKNNIFVIFLLQLTHTYALSVIFTLNIRSTWKRSLPSSSNPSNSRPSKAGTRPKRSNVSVSTNTGRTSLSGGIRVDVISMQRGEDTAEPSGNVDGYMLDASGIDSKRSAFSNMQKN